MNNELKPGWLQHQFDKVAEEPMEDALDWRQYLSSLSSELLEDMIDYIHDELCKRRDERMQEWNEDGYFAYPGVADLPPANEAELQMIADNQYIPAIKSYRDRLHLGLYEAKCGIDRYKKKGGRDGTYH